MYACGGCHGIDRSLLVLNVESGQFAHFDSYGRSNQARARDLSKKLSAALGYPTLLFENPDCPQQVLFCFNTECASYIPDTHCILFFTDE